MRTEPAVRVFDIQRIYTIHSWTNQTIDWCNSWEKTGWVLVYYPIFRAIPNHDFNVFFGTFRDDHYFVFIFFVLSALQSNEFLKWNYPKHLWTCSKKRVIELLCNRLESGIWRRVPGSWEIFLCWQGRGVLLNDNLPEHSTKYQKSDSYKTKTLKLWISSIYFIVEMQILL